MNKFTIDGKTYNALPFDFNLVCDLEDMGFSMEEMGDKDLKLARAYFGLCANLSKVESGLLIQSHMINGGTLEGLFEAMGKEIAESDFFRSLNKTEEEETPTEENPKRTTKKKTTE